MSHFAMNGSRDEDESSDSDHRNKRRKFNPALNGRTKVQTSPPAGAPPNAKPMSFAERMMAKMGHVEGQGLGATGKGRLAPIESQLRPQGAGLGAVKEKTKQAREEEKREAAFRGEILEDSEEEEEKIRKKKRKEKRASGVHSGGATPVKRKTKYRTAAEIEAAADGLQVPNVLKSIIDATGAETKLLTSASGLMSSYSTMVPSETEAEKIARRARRDLEAFADEWNTLSERLKYFELQESQMASEVVEEDDEIRKLADVIGAVQDLQRLSLENSTLEDLSSAWEATTSKLETLALAFQEPLGASSLHEIAVAAIHPLFKRSLVDWSPLSEPILLVPYFQRLAHILGGAPAAKGTELALQNGVSYTKPSRKSTTAYETMLYTLWLPPVRSAISNDWDPCDPTPLLTLITAWQPLLPAFIFTSLVDNLIVQRLTTTLQAWQPHRSSRKSRSPTPAPESYIFPWLPYLSTHHTSPTSPTGLLASVKQKFKSVLSTYPIERSPPNLSPWKSILGTSLSSILTRHLLPRLSSYLTTNLIIDPSDQDLTPLTTVQRWTSTLFSPSTSAQLLATAFFPQWHQTLHLWLTSSPNYDEIRQWFQWWRVQVQEEFLGLSPSPPTTTTAPSNNPVAVVQEIPPIIESEWSKALQMISLALDLGPERVAHDLPPPSQQHPPASAPPPPHPKPLPQPQQQKEQEFASTFRDVVEDFCTANSLLFLPLREADPTSGQPLFRITGSASGKGGVVGFLRGDVLWVRERGGGGGGGGEAGGRGGGFKPVGLEEGLVAMAEGRS